MRGVATLMLRLVGDANRRPGRLACTLMPLLLIRHRCGTCDR